MDVGDRQPDLTFGGQIGSQQPGQLFTFLPMNEEIDLILMGLRERGWAQPLTLAWPLHQETELHPAGGLGQPHEIIGTLAQNIPPMPAIELFKHRNVAKFGVSDQKNGCCIARNELMDISQQSQLFPHRAVASVVPHPGPGDGQGPTGKWRYTRSAVGLADVNVPVIRGQNVPPV